MLMSYGRTKVYKIRVSIFFVKRHMYRVEYLHDEDCSNSWLWV